MTRIPTRTHSLEQVIKRSRFVATVVRLQAAAASDALLASLHDSSASHHCWAWKVNGQYRSADDGEPGGSAGRPILAAIEAQNFEHTLVLVQRWFGGIKLGAGGLARAYGGSAAKCLQATPAELLIATANMQIISPHEHISVVHQTCAEHQATVLDQHWRSLCVQVRIELPVDEITALTQQLQDRSAGQISVVEI